MTRANAINTGWAHILSHYGLMDQITATGSAQITSAQLNDWHPKVDARLMVKFDRLEDRPQVFQDNGLALWPTGNGVFEIVQSLDPYIKIDPKKIKALPPRCFNARDLGFELDTLDIDAIRTENQALAIVKHSGILHAIHNANSHRLAQTDGGRNRQQTTPVCVSFTTPKGAIPLVSKGVQMEADAVYESDFLVTMTEAKVARGRSGLDKATSLHARQIVFPHIELAATMAAKESPKELESGLMYAWKKDAKSPWEFAWLPVEILQSTTTRFEVCWERAQRYVLVKDIDKDRAPEGRRMKRNDLAQVDTGRPDTKASFPQFNRFDVIDQIISDLGKLGGRDIIDDLPTSTARKWRKGEFFTLNKHQKRQVVAYDLNDLMNKFAYSASWQGRNRAYLVNALKWMGMVDDYCPVTNTIIPSDLCIMLAYVDGDVRYQRMWNILISSPVMKAVFEGREPTMAERVHDGLVNATTYARRKQTAHAWTKSLSSWMKASKGTSYVFA